MHRRIWLVSAVVAWSLACSGAMELPMGEPEVNEPEEDEVVAKKPLPAVEADVDERDPEDCMPESYEGFDRLLSEDQPNGGTPAVDASPNRIVETVVMKNGMEVRVTRGGCTHAGESWMVSPPPKGPWVASAKKVLKKVDTTDDPSVLRCLDDAPDPPPKTGWASGDANCTIGIEDGVLVFAYDFAL